MADTYEKDLAQKSSLTTSDFIRVVGSDNVSYKQSIPSVANIFSSIPRLNSTDLDYDTIYGDSPSFKVYAVGHLVKNAPEKNWFFLTSYRAESSYITQVAYGMTTDGVYMRRFQIGTTGTAWTKLPTRAEVDALNSKTEGLTRTYRWNNVNRFDIQLSATPSSNKYGQLILFNSNQRVLALIDIDDSPSVLPISGNITFTVTVSGTTLSVAASSTLWGATLGILQF